MLTKLLPVSPPPLQPLRNITGFYKIYRKLPKYTNIYWCLREFTGIYGPLMFSFHILLILCFLENCVLQAPIHAFRTPRSIDIQNI
jgi:hypothetical protein